MNKEFPAVKAGKLTIRKFMKSKLQGFLLAMVLLLCAGNVWASVTWTFDSTNQGSEWRYSKGLISTGKRSASEFNVKFAPPFEGVTNTLAVFVKIVVFKGI